MSSVRISQLDNLSAVTTDDYFPVVDSGSATTYRIYFSSLHDWLKVYGTASLSNTSSVAISAISASHAIRADTASYLLYSGTFNGTASYALVSLNADTASYVDITFVPNSTYSVSSSWASQSLYSINNISSSWASSSISSSYAITASYAFTADTAISASHALVADALATSTNIVVPSYVKELIIRPYWTPYDAENITIDITAEEVIVYNNSGDAKRLTSISQTNNRGVSGAGGLQGSWTQDEWYDIWVIYDSVNLLTSTIIINSGATPKQSVISLPGTYDYYVRIGSVLDEGAAFWRQWYEYGNRTVWVYRNDLPSSDSKEGGLTNEGYALTHYLNTPPRRTWVKLKIKKSDAYIPGPNYDVGDELRAEDFFLNINPDSEDGPPFSTRATSNLLEIWRGSHTGGGLHDPGGSGFINALRDGGWESWPASYFDMIVYSEK